MNVPILMFMQENCKKKKSIVIRRQNIYILNISKQNLINARSQVCLYQFFFFLWFQTRLNQTHFWTINFRIWDETLNLNN